MTQPTATPFSALSLTPATLANLAQLGYVDMTPIQAASLPVALAGGPDRAGEDGQRQDRRVLARAAGAPRRAPLRRRR